MLQADRLGSVIFYGPPGCGKTTLAQLLATETKSTFRQLSAVTSGVKDLREVLEAAQNELRGGGDRTLLFIDEIHRFNKAQQDALLPDVENGVITPVGATTSNPFFAVNNALTSRSTIFQFEPLSVEDIEQLLDRAPHDQFKGLGRYDVITDEARVFIAEVSDGDAVELFPFSRLEYCRVSHFRLSLIAIWRKSRFNVKPCNTMPAAMNTMTSPVH